MDITEVSIIHHVAMVLALLWILVSCGWAHPVVFFVSLVYLYMVNERYSLRLRRRLQFEERKYASQKRLLSDSESVRWLNHAVGKVWPICMEQIASQQFLLPIIPWFLDKYKPWTAKKAVVEHLYLGRNPPMFTEIRVLGESVDDDHLVLELGMNFLSADDMSAILALQLRKRLGFGMWANMHVTGMHIEGKDKILSVALEQTLVQPNMLVVDVEKFASAPTEPWFTVDEKPAIAYAKVEIIEAADLKPSDLNGLADPYVKGQLGHFRFRTKTQKKTLSPKWFEEFKMPISSWEAPNVLVLQMCDKDHIFDDMLGDCAINISDMRGGQRHDKWLSLRNIKTGRLHLAITVLEDKDGKDGKEEHQSVGDDGQSNIDETRTPRSPMPQKNNMDNISTEGGKKMADSYEPIPIEGQEKTGLWVHRPGSDVSQTWEPRKGRPRQTETVLNDCSDSPLSPESESPQSDADENVDGKKDRRPGMVKRGLRKIGNVFHSSSENESPTRERKEVVPSPQPNVPAVGENGTAARIVFDSSCDVNSGEQKVADKERCSPEKGDVKSPGKVHVKGITKNIIKQAGKSAHSLKSVLSRKASAKSKDEDQVSVTEDIEESQELDSPGDASKDHPIDVNSPSGNEMESLNGEEGKKESSESLRVEENVPVGDSVSVEEGNLKVEM